MITPTTPVSPFTIQSALEAANPVDMYMNDAMTIPPSLAGLPALSVPIATSDSTQLPVGLQIISAPKCESQLIHFGSVLERCALPAIQKL